MEEFVVIILLLPGLAFLVLIVMLLLVHHRDVAKMHKEGVCDRCGYNLTGNTSGACPECGLRFQSSGLSSRQEG